ncbi:hypothetical protein ACIPY5_03645 [Microbacterium sp. NPDC089698]|uniref:hypothetical protein n=1 Tax=Microbacterium sp. NPDC089698 TaxID=3364200 RepID=UPI00382F56C7
MPAPDPGAISTRAGFGECSQSGDENHQWNKNCSIERWDGIIAQHFYANFTYVTPGYDYIDSVWGVTYQVCGERARSARPTSASPSSTRTRPGLPWQSNASPPRSPSSAPCRTTWPCELDTWLVAVGAFGLALFSVLSASTVSDPAAGDSDGAMLASIAIGCGVVVVVGLTLGTQFRRTGEPRGSAESLS